ncbi:MAG: hypothetical protein P8127_01870 [Acidobacteriota bacterium]
MPNREDVLRAVDELSRVARLFTREEDRLRINRKDKDLSLNLSLYGPDVDRMETWEAPRAEEL